MFSVLIVTHGHFGEEVLSSAQMIYGDLGEHVHAFGLESGESPERLLMDIESYIKEESMPQGCLLIVDIPGGSPYIAAARAFNNLKETVHMAVITGLNLGMLLEVFSERNGLSLEEGKQLALSAARQSIFDLSECL